MTDSNNMHTTTIEYYFSTTDPSTGCFSEFEAETITCAQECARELDIDIKIYHLDDESLDSGRLAATVKSCGNVLYV